MTMGRDRGPTGINTGGSEAAANAAEAAANAAGKGWGANAAAAGGGIGLLGGPVGAILGTIAGAAIGGIFDSIQGAANRKQQEKMFKESQNLAERQFAWGQKIDTFNIKQQSQMQRAQLTQAQVDALNTQLKNNTELQNQVRSLWGGRR